MAATNEFTQKAHRKDALLNLNLNMLAVNPYQSN